MNDLQGAERLLARRVEAAHAQLQMRLEVARAAHDLTWRGLLSAQHHATALARAGFEPSGAEFWTATALPLSNALRLASFDIIDEEFARVAAGVAHYQRAAANDDSPVPSVDHQRNVTACLAPLRGISLNRTPLDRVGVRWQHRLHLAAARRIAGPLLVSPARQCRDRVAQSELHLLMHAPWLHGDRLLNAFETAHVDVRMHARRALVETLATPISGQLHEALGSHPADRSMVVSGGARRQLLAED